MTQPHSKFEQLEWEFRRTLGNSPHPILRTISRNGIKTNLRPTIILAIFQTRFAFCTTSVISRKVLNAFQGGSLLSSQTDCISNVSVLATIVMIKEMLTLLTQEHTSLRKASGIKQSQSVGVIRNSSLKKMRKEYQKF